MGGIISSPSMPTPEPYDDSHIKEEQTRLKKENDKLEQQNQARLRNLKRGSTGRNMLLFDDELGVTTPTPRKRFRDYLGG